MYVLISVFCSLNLVGQVNNAQGISLDRIPCRPSVKEKFVDSKACRNRLKTYTDTTGMACVKAFDKSKLIKFTNEDK